MKYVVVETVSVFTHKYLIAQDDDDPVEWASDTVLCDRPDDFTQEHADEIITRCYEADDGDIREAVKDTPYDTWGLPQIKETLSYYHPKPESFPEEEEF